MKKRNCQTGSVIIEFTLAGIACITILISSIQLCIGLWQYHTLAYAVHEATRYVTVHGRGCVTGTSACGITVGHIATKISANAVGLPADAMSATLTTASGAVTTCNPLASCSGNTTRWPPTSNFDNVTGKRVTIAVSYSFSHSMLVFWPGKATQRFAAYVFPAQSTQTILF